MEPYDKVYSPMWGITKPDWNQWTNEPYALIANIPEAVTIDGPTEWCLNPQGTTANYVAWGDHNDTYIWTITGGHIVGDSIHWGIQVMWDTPGTGIVTMQEITHFGYCPSEASSFAVTVYPRPIADFNVIPHDSDHIFVLDLIHFVDASVNAVQWQWDFGDGSLAVQQSPYHVYNAPGLYTVCLTVASANDCIDDTCKVVEVIEGIIIPNVLTPNGDGYNDVFDILASGMSEFYLQIFNRWGALIFESENAYVKWNGKTLAGADASDGTYYYILTAKSTTKDYSTHGFVTLIRQ
jgi:gliding motility-associated-like protein